MMKVFDFVGLSFVVWPVMAPSSTRQNFGSPSQPSRLLPSKMGRKPSSSAASPSYNFAASSAFSSASLHFPVASNARARIA